MTVLQNYDLAKLRMIAIFWTKIFDIVKLNNDNFECPESKRKYNGTCSIIHNSIIPEYNSIKKLYNLLSTVREVTAVWKILSKLFRLIIV